MIDESSRQQGAEREHCRWEQSFLPFLPGEDLAAGEVESVEHLDPLQRVRASCQVDVLWEVGEVEGLYC